MATGWMTASLLLPARPLGGSLYRIEFTPEALEDLASLRNFDLRRVVDEIEVQLKDAPTRETRKLARFTYELLARIIL
jgi:hypothetical protein